MGTRRKSALSVGAERFLKSAFVTPSSRLIRRAAKDRPPKIALRAMVREIEQAAGPDDLGTLVAELLSLIRSEAAAGPLKPIGVPAPTNDIETAICAHFDKLPEGLCSGNRLTCSRVFRVLWLRDERMRACASAPRKRLPGSRTLAQDATNSKRRILYVV